MPPTISARIEEEKVEALKAETDAEKDSEALRSAIDYVVEQDQSLSAYQGMVAALGYMTFEAYGEINVEQSFGPFLLVMLCLLIVLPKLSRWYHQRTAEAESA